MASPLETAADPEGLRRVVIEPLTRVEGHGKVTLLLDEDNRIQQARLHIVEFRGFEKFIQGRPYWELPVLVQRLCGICPVSHHLAAAKATGSAGGRRPAHPDGGEGATAHALWADAAVPCPAFFPPVLPGSAVRLRRCGGAPQHRGPDPGPRRSPSRGVAAQVRPGGHPCHGREADPRNRRHPGRRQQVAECDERDYLLKDIDR